MKQASLLDRPEWWEATGGHILFLLLPFFEQTHCTNAKDYPVVADITQIALRYPTVTCPGCRSPMTPSPPLPVSADTDLCDVTFTCKNCGAITTRTMKIGNNR